MSEQPKTDAPGKPAADEIERHHLEHHLERAQSVYGASTHEIVGALSADRRRKTWSEDDVSAALKTFRDPKQTPGHPE